MLSYLHHTTKKKNWKNVKNNTRPRIKTIDHTIATMNKLITTLRTTIWPVVDLPNWVVQNIYQQSIKIRNHDKVKINVPSLQLQSLYHIKKSLVWKNIFNKNFILNPILFPSTNWYGKNFLRISFSTEMGKTGIRKLNILIKTGMKQRQSWK